MVAVTHTAAPGLRLGSVAELGDAGSVQGVVSAPSNGHRTRTEGARSGSAGDESVSSPVSPGHLETIISITSY